MNQLHENGGICTVGANPSSWEHDRLILHQANRKKEIGRALQGGVIEKTPTLNPRTQRDWGHQVQERNSV